jgi:hypothetical protein
MLRRKLVMDIAIGLGTWSRCEERCPGETPRSVRAWAASTLGAGEAARELSANFCITGSGFVMANAWW